MTVIPSENQDFKPTPKGDRLFRVYAQHFEVGEPILEKSLFAFDTAGAISAAMQFFAARWSADQIKTISCCEVLI